MPASFYVVLGVAPSATQDEIHKAHKAASSKYHPDRNPGFPEEAARRFIEVSDAYRVLSDPMQRAAYDRDPRGFHPTPEAPPPPYRAPGQPPGAPDVLDAVADGADVLGGIVEYFAPPGRAGEGQRAINGLARLLGRVIVKRRDRSGQ